MYRLIRPALFALDAERAHEATVGALSCVARSGPVRRWLAGRFERRDPRLEVHAFGVRFPAPVGVAAGLDKTGAALPIWGALGFGHVEIGTVTPRPQPGNPRPRVVRLPADRAVINAMGFPSEGVEAALRRFERWRDAGAWPDVPVGVNLGKNAATPFASAADDYRTVARLAAPWADWLAINVSSPNTEGLRGLQDADRLRDLVAAVVEDADGTPVLVKLGPDLDEEAASAAARVVEAAGAAGLIATNTTVARAGLRHDPGRPGGLSGRPLQLRARATLRTLRAATDLPIVSVGGIDGPEEALARIVAGADLLQLYTALIYDGPGLVARVHDGLIRELDRTGATSLRELRRLAPPGAVAAPRS